MAVHDVIFELNHLQALGLISAYAIGGAVAAHAYIEPSETEDLDVFVVVGGDDGNSLDPLRAVTGELVSRGAVWDGPYLVIGGWPVQLLLPANPLYAEGIAQARSLDFGNGVLGQVMRPEHLVAIALQTRRSKDFVRVDQFIKRSALDMAMLNGLIQRHGLAESWRRFQNIFPETDVTS